MLNAEEMSDFEDEMGNDLRPNEPNEFEKEVNQRLREFQEKRGLKGFEEEKEEEEIDIKGEGAPSMTTVSAPSQNSPDVI